MARIDFALSPAQRADAREALRLLAGSDLSLAAAALRALEGRRAVRRVSVEQAADLFLRTRLHRRSATVQWYEAKLAHLVGAFGPRQMDEVTRPMLAAWLQGTGLSAGTRAALVRAARALWRWAERSDPPLAAGDATAGLAGTAPGRAKEAEFLTVDEVARILRGAGVYQAGLALLFFAGVRPQELHGQDKPPLLWRHVRGAEKLIRIPGEMAKTGRPRILERLPEAVWAWLGPAGRDDAPVCVARSVQAIKRAKAALGGRPWPHDATRHTFATYAFAAQRDAGLVASWLGHEGAPSVFHRHYRGLATAAEAERFWGLRPG